MRACRKTVYATLGILLVLVSVAGVPLVYLGPWRSCPEADNNMGCPGTPGDVGLLGVAVIVLVAGIMLLAISVSMRKEIVPSDAAGPFGDAI